MQAKIKFEVSKETKTWVKAQALAFMDSDQCYPQPNSRWVDSQRWLYNTTSYLGAWLIDFSSRGEIIVSFEGRRNSFLSGNCFLHIDVPMLETVQEYIGADTVAHIRNSGFSGGYMRIRGTIMSLESSNSKPLLPKRQDDPILHNGEVVGYYVSD